MCTSLEQHAFRSLLCSLLWLLQTRFDIAIDVVVLQTRVQSATILDIKQANSLLAKSKRNSTMAGLFFPKLSMPLRISCICDASHGTKLTSYAHEAQMVLLMEDRPLQCDSNDIVISQHVSNVGGPAHCLSATVRKSKRISHSTSHAETLSGCGGTQLAQMIA